MQINFERLKSMLDLSNDDGLSLQALMSLSFLLLIVVLVFGPCYQPFTPPVPTPVPTAGAAAAGPAGLTVQPLPRSRVLYLAAAATPTPAEPAPTATATPTVIPTPPGGGFRQIAFASNRGDGRFYQIYMMDANGENLVRLTHTTSFDRDPHFSYDGKHLAFCSDRAGGTYQLFFLDLETHETRQLTYGEGDKTNPIWSPDDRLILFTYHKGTNQQLGMIRPDGTDMRHITATYGNNHAYSFSHDGTKVAYESSVNNRQEVFVMDLTTNKCELLIRSGDLSNHSDPVFSPAGKYLIFASDTYTPRVRQLFVYNLEMSSVKRLTNDNLDRDDPVYSPDGTMIAYIALWENAWNIFVMNADGSNVRNLTQSYYDNSVPTWR